MQSTTSVFSHALLLFCTCLPHIPSASVSCPISYLASLMLSFPFHFFSPQTPSPHMLLHTFTLLPHAAASAPWCKQWNISSIKQSWRCVACLLYLPPSPFFHSIHSFSWFIARDFSLSLWDTWAMRSSFSMVKAGEGVRAKWGRSGKCRGQVVVLFTLSLWFCRLYRQEKKEEFQNCKFTLIPCHVFLSVYLY